MDKRKILVLGTVAIAASYLLFSRRAVAEVYSGPTPQPQRVPGGIEIVPEPEIVESGIDLGAVFSSIFNIFNAPKPIPETATWTEELPTYQTQWDDWEDYDPALSEDFALDFEQGYDTPTPFYIEDYAMASPDDNLDAFLAMLRVFEAGTDGSRGYSTLIGGGQFFDFSEHPWILDPNKPAIQSGNLPASRAAGAYQFLPQTWSEARDAMGLPDFSPASQDAAALFLIRRRGALDDVQNGNFSTAIVKLGREWASLPGSPYGQTSKTLAQAETVYTQFGGTIA